MLYSCWCGGGITTILYRFVHDVLERYHSLVVQFAINGIEVHSFDLPGFEETALVPIHKVELECECNLLCC